MKDFNVVILLVSTILCLPGTNVVTSFTFQNKPTNHLNQKLSSLSSSLSSRTKLNVGITTTSTTVTTSSSQSIQTETIEGAVLDYGKDISIGMYEYEGWN